MLKNFKDFATRSDGLSLAAVIVIALAFGKIVAGLVNDIIPPIVGIFSKADFGNYFIPLSSAVTASNLADARKQGEVLALGDVVTGVVNFLIIAVILFLVIRFVNSLKKNETRLDAGDERLSLAARERKQRETVSGEAPAATLTRQGVRGFAAILASMPPVGADADFERVDAPAKAPNVFD